MVVIGEREQIRAKQGRPFEVERQRGQLMDPALALGLLSDGDLLECELDIRLKDLGGGAVALREGGAKCGVAPNQIPKAELQRRDVQRSGEPDAAHLVVSASRAPELVDEPQPLLGERAGRAAALRAGLERRARLRGALARAAHGFSQPGHRRGVEEVREAHGSQQDVIDRGEHAHGRQRLSAQVEEVRVYIHGLDPECVLPDTADRRFQWRPRRYHGRRKRTPCILLKVAHGAIVAPDTRAILRCGGASGNRRGSSGRF